MGGSKAQTIGYKIYLGMHMVFTHGPVDAILRMTVDDRTAWEGRQETAGPITINNPGLFGGEEREGGIQGTVDFCPGAEDQIENDYLQSQLGDVPAFLGVAALVLRKVYLGMNPYLKRWAARLQRIHVRHGGETQWYDEKAAILTDSFSVSAQLSDWRSLQIAATDNTDYSSPSYDDSGWAVNPAPFGGWEDGYGSAEIAAGAPGGLNSANDYDARFSATFATNWTPNTRLWLRRNMNVVSMPSGPLKITMYIEDHCKLYVNGVEILSTPADHDGGIGQYFEVTDHHLVIGNNAIAIRCDDEAVTPGISVTYFDAIFEAVTTSTFYDMNPAHIIRECLTDRNWGMGYQDADVDDDAFTYAADQLWDEGMGISLLWDRQVPIEDFIKEILKHIDGTLFVSRTTGKFKLKLIRDDYVKEDLIHLDTGNVEKVEKFSRPLFGELVNSVTVNFWDQRSGKTASLTVQDIALAQTQGATINTTLQYPGFSNTTLASRVASRDLRSLSVPIINATVFATTAQAAELELGDAFVLDWPEYGVVDTVMRVTNIAFGNGQTSKIRVICTQDTYALPEAIFAPPPDTEWTDPNAPPVAASPRAAYEAPYGELVQVLGQTEINAKLADNPDLGYVQAAGGRATSGLLNMVLSTDSGSGFERYGTVDFCPYATTAEDVDRLVETVTLAATTDVDQVSVNSYAKWGNEYIKVVSIVGLELTMKRGVLDTVPEEHLTGSTIMFVDAWAESDNVEYATAEAVDVKLLTVSGRGQLSEADVPTDSVTLDQRAYRPYPPGQFKVNGESYPAGLAGLDVTVSWVHRDRLLQADQLLGTDEAGIGPEVGTTYTVRIYKDGVLVNTESGISGTSSTLYTFSGAGTGRVELESVRDGVASWQYHWCEFDLDAPTQYVALPLTYDEVDSTATMTWVRQGNGPHVTPDGFEGDGYEARLKSTTIPAWMSSASAVFTMHASISFYPQQLKSTSEFVVYAGEDDSTPTAKLIMTVVPDATNTKISQMAVRGGTGGAGFVEKLLGRSSWKYQLRAPDLTLNIGGTDYEARMQCALFLDASTLILSAHFEDQKTRVWKVDPATGTVLGYFDCTGDWVHIGIMGRRSNGDVWVSSTANKMCRVDLAASFTAGTMVFDSVITQSSLVVGGLEFVTVAGTEYLIIPEYLTAGSPYFYAFPASTVLAGSTIAPTDRYKRFTGAPIETQGCAMRSGKLIVSAVAAMGTGTTERWGHIHQVDIVTAISSTADGGAVTSEARWDHASKYAEDIAIHPTTNDVWGGTEGITAVGSDAGGLSVWSNKLDNALAENHYTVEYDGAGTTTIKVNGRIYDTMPGTLAIAVACVCIGGPPTVTGGISNRFFTGFVRNVVFQDQPMSEAEYTLAIGGGHEPNSLTAYEFTLTNPGGETNTTTGWTNETGGLGVLEYPTTSATVPYAGTHFFSGGTSATTVARQRLDVLAQTGLTGTQVDAGGIWAKVRWAQGNVDSLNDSGAMGLRTLNGTPTTLVEAYAGLAITPNASGTYRPWYPRCFAAMLGTGTRFIDALIKAVRSSGTNNDSFFDGVRVTVYRQ